MDGVSTLRVMGSIEGPLEGLRRSLPIFALVIASTRTSTRPGVSVAGPTPEATLYTPALDSEYLVLGEPRSLRSVPVTPEGVPTPAVVSRALLERLGVPLIVVDAGSHVEPLIPHVDLPSRSVGGSIDSEAALKPGTARRLYEEARILGRHLGRRGYLVIGESMPGGTTTAMAILEALGYRARGRMSSAGPVNPHGLKSRIVEASLSRSGLNPGDADVFEAVDSVGDPLHVSIAGMAWGAIESGGGVVLAGGTQMCSVVAIMKSLGLDYGGRLAIATTKWIVDDPSSDIEGLLRDIDPGVPLAYTDFSMAKSRFRGLRAYEEGYVKEGVGMGGALVMAGLRGVSGGEVLSLVESEYERLIRLGAGEKGVL